MCPSISRQSLPRITTTRRLKPRRPRFVVPIHLRGQRMPRSPLARGVDEEDRHHAAHQGKFLRGLDNPVHAAAEARAIFARAEEQGVEECGVPDGEEK